MCLNDTHWNSMHLCCWNTYSFLIVLYSVYNWRFALYLGGLHKVTMFNSLFRVLPSRVSDFLTASYFTGGLENDDHAWDNEKLSCVPVQRSLIRARWKVHYEWSIFRWNISTQYTVICHLHKFTNVLISQQHKEIRLTRDECNRCYENVLL